MGLGNWLYDDSNGNAVYKDARGVKRYKNGTLAPGTVALNPHGRGSVSKNIQDANMKTWGGDLGRLREILQDMLRDSNTTTKDKLKIIEMVYKYTVPSLPITQHITTPENKNIKVEFIGNKD